MELTAVISALELLTEPCAVALYSDSKYVIDGISKGWAVSWRRKGWKKSDGKPALNPALWEKLLNLCDTHKVTFNWVKGHNDNPGNERCDELARNAIKDLRGK
jgi:ribonuclease HI